MEYRVLGPIEIADGDGSTVGVGGPLMRRLLAVLVINAGRVVPVDRLIDAVWGDNPPVAADATLQTYVSRLRRSVGDGEHRIVSRPPGYVLVANGDLIDSRRFEETLVAGRAAMVDGDEERAVALLNDALMLWRGRALLEFADEPWAQVDARRLEEQRLVALEELAAARLAVAPASEVVPELERLVAEQPLRERPLSLLMTALYRCGRHAEALRAFQDHRLAMSDELGLEPSTELRLLERQILDQDPSLAKPPVGRALRGYRLVEQIRSGDSGETWLAVQPSVGREVVIKMIPASVANDPQFIRRFEAEAQMVAGLEHPHIVPMYDYWREAGGAYLVLRYLRGGSLASALLTRRPVNDSLMVAGQIADALAEAHRHGVMHGQLSPGDILLDAGGSAYIADFAIAVALAEHSDTADDVRSLGLLLAEMLAAPQPFDRSLDPVDQLRRLRPDLSAAVIDIISRSTRSLSADSFTSAEEFSSACDGARSAGGRSRRARSTLGDRNPYKGLRPFEESDAADFFGRDGLIDELVNRLAAGARFITVIGPSGSGKSSLVRAGLLPVVRRGAIAGSWFVTTMTPGDDPLAELTMAIGRVAVRPIAELRQSLEAAGGFGRAVRGALPDDGSELLLVVDQLEEIFTVCQNEDARKAFLEGLAHAAFDARSRVRIITTLRADFYDRPLQYRAFAMLLDAGSLTVVPPSPDELEAAIIGPAARSGVELESGLMSHLVSELGERPAALALLQFTMAELFDQRRSGILTLDACRTIGGVTGALAHRADATFDSLTPEQQEIAR
ncbi:MAG TPA: BTAD domain-containing putative transcriptional regulator, partial [Ilumatobacteraceae bacterium]